MTQTEKSGFIFDKSTEPDDDLVKELLGAASGLRTAFYDFILIEAGKIVTEWKFYSKKTGWTMKTLLGKRNLFFSTPMQESFALTFVFGDRAVNAIMDSDVSETIKLELQNARKYMEGRGIRILIRDSESLEQAKKLLKIKLKF